MLFEAELSAALLEESWPDYRELAAARMQEQEANTPLPERVWALRNVARTLALGGDGERLRARGLLEQAVGLKQVFCGGPSHPGALLVCLFMHTAAVCLFVHAHNCCFSTSLLLFYACVCGWCVYHSTWQRLLVPHFSANTLSQKTPHASRAISPSVCSFFEIAYDVVRLTLRACVLNTWSFFGAYVFMLLHCSARHRLPT